MRVIITAGFSRSLPALALAELLFRDGIEIAGLLVVTPFSVRRARGFLRQRGVAAVKATLPRLLGRNSAGVGKAGNVLRLLRDEKIRPESLAKWARRRSVPLRKVANLNSDESLNFIRDAASDYVVYCGGGILRRDLIDLAKGRVLNAHAGPLPQVRGMNAVEWSIALGLTPEVTIHLIDYGIDTGTIIVREPIPIRVGDTIDELRERAVAIGIRQLHKVIVNPPSELPLRSDPAIGRQCFIVAPAMLELVESRLDAMQRHVR